MKTSVLCCRLSWAILVMAICVLAAGVHLPGQVASNEAYNFIKKASSATWVNKPLPIGKTPTSERVSFNDRKNDKKGFVRYVNNAVLEDGQKYALSVLQTHPEWKNGGVIIGYYPNVDIPANAKFSAKVGFLNGATASDGVIFEVSVYDIAARGGRRLIRHQAKHDGKLDEISADLKSYSGKKLRIELKVYAGNSSAQDWAVWQEASIVTAPMLAAAKVSTAIKATPKDRAQVQKTPTIKPGMRQKMPKLTLRPVGTPPPKHDITYLGPVEVEEPIALSEHIYRDNKNRAVYYFLPKEINMIRGRDAGSYKINAVWTQDKKDQSHLLPQRRYQPSRYQDPGRGGEKKIRQKRRSEASSLR